MKRLTYGKWLVCLTFLCGEPVLLAAPTTSFPEGCYFSSSKSEEDAAQDPDAILFWLKVSKSGNTYQGKISNILTQEFISNLTPKNDIQAIEAQINALVAEKYIGTSTTIAVQSVVSDGAMEGSGQGRAFLMFAQEIQSGPTLKTSFKEEHFRYLLLEYLPIPIPLYPVQCQ